MNKEITTQTISGGFVFVIGLAMFSLLNNGYKKPITFGVIYVFAIIIQIILIKKVQKVNPTKKKKSWTNYGFLFLGITCWLSAIVGIKLFHNISILWILVLFFVGIHFLFFIPANNYKHWQIQIIMVLLLTINTVLGFFIYYNTLNLVFVIDGLIKMVYGLTMIYVTTRD